MSKFEELDKKSKVILNDIGILTVQLHTLNHMYAEVMAQIKSIENEKEV